MNAPYRFSTIGLQDAEAWAELTNHLAEVDGTEEFYAADDRAEELQNPRTDPERDTVSVWSGEQMVGFGTVRVPSSPDHQDGRVDVGLDGGVHAEHRGAGLGTRIMELLEARGAELKEARHPGTDWFFSAGGGREGSSARAFHARRGYQVARYFHLMTRQLGRGDIGLASAAPLPQGLRLRAPEPGDEQAVLAAHAAAFVDHWGSTAPDPEVWRQRWRARSNRHTVSRILVDEAGAIDSPGSVLAYALCGQWVEEEIYVNLVGTVPQARGRGLGSAVLGGTIAASAESGQYTTIELDVDTESLTGATRLYERLGFTVKHTTAAMQRYPALQTRSPHDD